MFETLLSFRKPIIALKYPIITSRVSTACNVLSLLFLPHRNYSRRFFRGKLVRFDINVDDDTSYFPVGGEEEPSKEEGEDEERKDPNRTNVVL